MKFCHYGANNGRIVIYFHGAPGAPEECVVFDRYAKENGLRFICFDRFTIGSSIVGEAYYQFLAQEISKLADGRQVDFIGFSIGAFIALQTCRYLPDGVKCLHLISAAAPLEAGDFLNAMAGKQVFQIAKAFPALFVLLSYWQELLALLFPNALFHLLFASAVGKDQVLADNAGFKASISKILRSCFVGNVQGYIREIIAYVQPWETTLSEISGNTLIWHGAEDNWSPKMMAEYLKSAIPGCSYIEIMEGLSHYSCLYEAVPKICKQLGKT
ncbi:alpha/beta fold hydrolase [Methyloglobulus morosus]|uniref:alpha/beta fold hydrolase n=1 Tax=Methyloglobulus morosus TaxID=1410681 RepID=UPI0019110D81|nr:alpha/beta hydrolase [Methyloglobulus morosus]